MNQTLKKYLEAQVKKGWINENSLEWYFINKYPPEVQRLPKGSGKEYIGSPYKYRDSEEFKKFQEDLMEIFYDLRYGFNQPDGIYYKENDILKKEDVDDFLLNRDNYDDDGREACIVIDCVYKISILEHNIIPDNPQKIIEEINEIKRNNPDLETIYDIQIEYEARYLSPKTLKKLYEFKKKEKVYGKIEFYMKQNESLRNKNIKLEEENTCFVMKNDKLKMISKWLNDNSDSINFKIGKELYDILNQ